MSALDDAVSFYDDETGGIDENATAKKARAELDALRAQMVTSEKLLTERDRLLAAIPPCEAHGAGCVPHAIEWVEEVAAELPQQLAAVARLRAILADLLAVANPEYDDWDDCFFCENNKRDGHKADCKFELAKNKAKAELDAPAQEARE